MPIIEVDHVTKEYQLGQLQSARQTALNAVNRLRGHPVEVRKPFKALDDVHFSVEEGEVLGIIGHNGAGKSTLLKLLANISRPTSGGIKIKGKIAPLIEVGAGFVADLTGRENVYLNGAILGLSRKEIDRKFDEIVDFAEMTEFIDTPVKRYSSGMQIKLAFSVATSINADILIIDEVLAVGDLAFQRKCFDRMEEMIKKQGKTVLLVSHNIRQVQRLCGRAVLLDHGRILSDADSDIVCNKFYELSDKQISDFKKHTEKQNISSAGDVALLSIQALNNKGDICNPVIYNEDITFRLRLQVTEHLKEPIVSLGVHTTDFLYLATTSNKLGKSLAPGVYDIDCRIVKFPFLPRNYAIRISVVAGEHMTPIFYGENLATFNVDSKQINRVYSSEGFVRMTCEWTTHSITSGEQGV